MTRAICSSFDEKGPTDIPSYQISVEDKQIDWKRG